MRVRLDATPTGIAPELAVMPLGTANDFATACQIPVDLEHALTLAQAGKSVPVDCVKQITDILSMSPVVALVPK